jgi:hypothetical protein
VRDGSGERDTLLNRLTFYAVSRPDSLIYDSARNVRTMEFPLPGESESSADFVFSVDSLSDHFEVFKESRLVLVSYACGFVYAHELMGMEYSNQVIDTIIIKYPFVEGTGDQNLKIYIRPSAVHDTVD